MHKPEGYYILERVHMQAQKDHGFCSPQELATRRAMQRWLVNEWKPADPNGYLKGGEVVYYHKPSIGIQE